MSFELLPCAMQCSQQFKWNNPFKPYNIPMKWVLFLFRLYA